MSSRKSVFEFVRERIVLINAVFVFSGALVVALDLVAPKESYFVAVGVSLASVFVLLLFADLIFPEALHVLKPIRGLWMGQSRIWRSAAWQFLLASSLLILGLGAYFKAKVETDIVLAHQFEPVGVLQQKLLSTQIDLRDIKVALNAVRHEDTCKQLATQSIEPGEDGLETQNDIDALLLITQACITVNERKLHMLKRVLQTDQSHS